jgi:hypothetical protein
MKPGVSLHVTGDLPIRFVTSCRAWNVSSDVEGVLMISTSFIAGGQSTSDGKTPMPRTWDGY